MVNAHPGRRQRRNFVSGDERAATGSNRAKLGYRFTVTGDNEGFARHNCFDHLRVLIAQLALRDNLSHRSIVARSATVSYAFAAGLVIGLSSNDRNESSTHSWLDVTIRNRYRRAPAPRDLEFASMWLYSPPQVTIALTIIAASGAAIGAQLSAAIVFVVVMLAIVEIILVGCLVAPVKTQEVLRPLHDWVQARRRQVLAGVFGSYWAVADGHRYGHHLIWWRSARLPCAAAVSPLSCGGHLGDAVSSWALKTGKPESVDGTGEVMDEREMLLNPVNSSW